MIILSRQARDKHRENSKKEAFSCRRDVALLCGVPCQETLLYNTTAETPIPWGSEKMYLNMKQKQLISAILKHDKTGVVTTAAVQLLEAGKMRARIAQAPRKQVLELFKLMDIKFEQGMPRREMARLPTWEQLQRMLVSELSDGDLSEDEADVYVTLKPAPVETIVEPLPGAPVVAVEEQSEAVGSGGAT